MAHLTMNVKGLARLCINPFAIDEGLLLEQRRVVELEESAVSIGSLRVVESTHFWYTVSHGV